jgi:hypothetical protein
MTMRDRVKELRRVPASELRANPKNWRRHPPAQKAALEGVLEDIGFADVVIARETDDGLELIDGHLRQEVMGDQDIPVLIVDVTEEEADKMLLTLDPLAMMAEADHQALRALMEDLTIPSSSVREMLAELIEDVTPSGTGIDNTRMILDQAVQLKPQREYIVVMCDTDAEFGQLIEHLQLKNVRRGGYRQPAKTREATGIERVITARRLLDACRNPE